MKWSRRNYEASTQDKQGEVPMKLVLVIKATPGLQQQYLDYLDEHAQPKP